MKTQAEYGAFASLDIRVGKIIDVQDSKSTKPTYKMTVDFGPEIGKKISCGAYRNYKKEDLIGRTVVGVVNFAPKKMGPEISECLILGAANSKNETIYLTTESEIEPGTQVF